ncbi:uncharacterized protein MELLADRAFT_69583 [Melampsora larici-populina 98AG31]|uniref:Transcription factor tau subunit sfc3/Tfc3 C-terminal domain-containing protein n=1 Tax=Melampsora larici-populina (strain 98AG31 / pathotype 3-4-7) TaxID=747676 RepID=F4SB92_MELLP|nr:uncharacterized protein MELLADRAFT_69583 [Melampsora larici-populina 98AG31]EGF98084.1 hypothetical protein MELLADRAFT_69583 [Melampsora larici-populina 98AG31]
MIPRTTRSSARLEQQRLEAIRFAGGIAEKTQDLAKAVRDLAGPGQQVSAANPMDSRTLNTTLWALQTRGEIKVTTVMVPDAIGNPVRRSVVYLASIPLDSPEMINWLEDLQARDHILQNQALNVPTRKPVVRDGPLPNTNAARREMRRTLVDASEDALQAMFKNQWRFNHLQSPPPSLAKWPLKNVDDGNRFWTKLHRASLPDPEAPPLQHTFESLNENDQFSAFADSHTLLQLLTDQSNQREQAIRLNNKHKDPPLDLENDTQEVEHLARISCTTPEAFKKTIQATKDLAGKRKAKKKLRKKELGSDAENNKLSDEAAIQAKLLKVKKIKVAPKPHYDRGALHKFPECPLRWSAITAHAIRPHLQVVIGLRPPTTISVPGKRTRLEWSDTLDEFLRDLAAILRVRAYAICASLWPWSIATNVFKDTWSHLYFARRGKVPELLDPSPTMSLVLDGGLALDYLRLNIDKEYLRSQVNVQGEADVPSEFPSPDTLEEFYKVYQITQSSKPSERWDQVHLSANNVIREDTMLSEAFSMCTEFSNDLEAVPNQPTRQIMRASEAIKLLTSTSIETYSKPVATCFLSHHGENILIAATKYLHSMGMMIFGSKFLLILDGNLGLICPPDNRVVRPYKLDEAMEQLRSQCDDNSDGKVNWFLFATDTETAALLHAFSQNQVSYKSN